MRVRTYAYLLALLLDAGCGWAEADEIASDMAQS